jgi:hypothetical protein
MSVERLTATITCYSAELEKERYSTGSSFESQTTVKAIALNLFPYPQLWEQ